MVYGKGKVIEIVKSLIYLSVVLTPGGSFLETTLMFGFF